MGTLLPCRKCKGTGGIETIEYSYVGNPPEQVLERCPDCNGSGEVEEHRTVHDLMQALEDSIAEARAQRRAETKEG